MYSFPRWGEKVNKRSTHQWAFPCIARPTTNETTKILPRPLQWKTSPGNPFGFRTTHTSGCHHTKDTARALSDTTVPVTSLSQRYHRLRNHATRRSTQQRNRLCVLAPVWLAGTFCEPNGFCVSTWWDLRSITPCARTRLVYIASTLWMPLNQLLRHNSDTTTVRLQVRLRISQNRVWSTFYCLTVNYADVHSTFLRFLRV